MQDLTAQSTTNAPGRSCPLHYRYSPANFLVEPEPILDNLDVIYIVGGLYGNKLALDEVLRLFEAETGAKRLVFNGDFHWFDIDPQTFSAVQDSVLKHVAIRGNVETELTENDTSAGCGCAYPDWVDDRIVTRSNRIMTQLHKCATPFIQAQISALPMWRLARVGKHRIGIVHGDAQSLAGWGFAQEHLQDPAHRAEVSRWFEEANVSIFASSHTCLPVFQEIGLTGNGRSGWVLNNGAAGMPNFKDDFAGLLTRISLKPLKHAHSVVLSRASVKFEELFIDAVGIETNQDQTMQQFLSNWPQTSDAHESYFNRIVSGPDYSTSQVIRRQA
jgi:hypothetical protein